MENEINQIQGLEAHHKGRLYNYGSMHNRYGNAADDVIKKLALTY